MKPVLALLFCLALVPPALAEGQSSLRTVRDQPLLLAQADCSAAAERAAQDTGGRVLSARPSGNGTCEVTLLVPNEASRPSRVVVTVPV